jgi:hypothetical protein
MMPAYGMSEATLAISFSPLLKEPVVTAFNRTMLQKEGIARPEKVKASDMIELVSLGKVLNVQKCIVDDDGNVLEDR